MHVIVIDDEIAIVHPILILLRRMGHKAEGYDNPQEALAKLSKETDLVITDITMPGMNGFEVTQKVVSLLGKDIPRVILMSGMDDDASLHPYPPSVVIALMHKPISLAYFSKIVFLLERTRLQCPGTLGSFCSHRESFLPEHDGDLKKTCFSTAYGTCPYYDNLCGMSFRSAFVAEQPRV